MKDLVIVLIVGVVIYLGLTYYVLDLFSLNPNINPILIQVIGASVAFAFVVVGLIRRKK